MEVNELKARGGEINAIEKPKCYIPIMDDYSNKELLKMVNQDDIDDLLDYDAEDRGNNDIVSYDVVYPTPANDEYFIRHFDSMKEAIEYVEQLKDSKLSNLLCK